MLLNYDVAYGGNDEEQVPRNSRRRTCSPTAPYGGALTLRKPAQSGCDAACAVMLGGSNGSRTQDHPASVESDNSQTRGWSNIGSSGRAIR